MIAMLIFASSCSKNLSPFGDFNKDGYTVSVKYDANGGLFTTNTSEIVDTYSLEGYKANAEGKKELKLFAPDAQERGSQAYTATRQDYYLAGWYTERTEVKDSDGNVTGYTYGGRWDFGSDKLKLDADGKYDANNPVITLYAAWVPAFKYEFYLLNGTGAELKKEVTLSPFGNLDLTLPAYDSTSGLVGAPNDFPELEGMTYDKIYKDADMSVEITGETLTHSGSFSAADATLTDPVMKIYCTATAGVQYRITTPEQLKNAADPTAQYTIEADLDFENKIAWPAKFTTGEFTGRIIGNGHTVKNVKISRNSPTGATFGLFGTIASDADISGLTFDGIEVAVSKFSKASGEMFGILAGEIANGASLSAIELKNSNITIANTIDLITALKKAPKFGLVCAEGELTGITFSADNVTVTIPTGLREYSCATDASGRFTLTEIQSGT